MELNHQGLKPINTNNLKSHYTTHQQHIYHRGIKATNVHKCIGIKYNKTKAMNVIKASKRKCQQNIQIC